MSEIEQIGKNLWDLRRQANLSRKKVSYVLGVSGQQIQKYERGIDRISADKLFRLRYLYNVPYEAFFVGLDIPDYE